MGNTKNVLRVVTVKLPDALDRKLRDVARSRKATRSSIVRDAIESYTGEAPKSVTAAAGELVGSLRGPRNLASGKRHMAGYGE